jgi:alpha,alpha-trehalase
MYAKRAVIMAFAIHVGLANVKANENDPDTTGEFVINSDQVNTQATSVASPTASLSATLPSQVPPPPPQAWCPSKIFCPGAVRHVISPCSLEVDVHVYFYRD